LIDSSDSYKLVLSRVVLDAQAIELGRKIICSVFERLMLDCRISVITARILIFLLTLTDGQPVQQLVDVR
jgi:hypothetical protein